MGNLWNHIRVWFHDSETIVWARLQVLFGAIIGLVTMVDPSLITGVLPSKWVPFWLLVSGLITEYVRRNREPHDLGVKTVADLTAPKSPTAGDKLS